MALEIGGVTVHVSRFVNPESLEEITTVATVDGTGILGKDTLAIRKELDLANVPALAAAVYTILAMADAALAGKSAEVSAAIAK